MFDMRDLECLSVLADELHFGRAAERLSLAQPALTKRIQKAEVILGVELFERSSAGVRLTMEGREVVLHAREMLGNWQAMRTKAAEMRTGHRGDVRIGAVGSAFYEALPMLLSRARQELPDVRLIVEEMETPALVEALRFGEIQLGFVRPPVGYGLVTQTVWVEPLVAAVPQDDELASREAIDVHDLAARAVIFFPRAAGPGYWDRVSALFADAGVEFAPLVTAGHVTTILGQIALGAGVSVVPASATRVVIPGVEYVPLSGDSALPLAIACHPPALTAAARRVIDTMPATPLRR
ncbi:LysR family transcriptional regulator [Microbacterium sp. 179-I 3D4 NHS]|uniref:LysR family transcriptional regulator n=1 Tax=Microbacterium sp. 179-I 3D4 NHS TaxID=3142381 RepID=UPI00399FCEB6